MRWTYASSPRRATGSKSWSSEACLRSDLFYRLNIMYVMIPPLRERGGDIELLAAHFVEQLNRRYEGPATLDAASSSWLLTQPWPGNVRQLENFLERECLMAEGSAVLHFSALPEAAAEPEGEGWNYRSAKARVVENFDRHYLADLMRFARGNVTLAARAAGKERRDFGRLLRKYAIEPESFRLETQV